MKLKNKAFLFFLAFVILIIGQPSISASAAPDEVEIQDAILQEISLDGVKGYWDNLANDYGGFLPDLEKTSIYEFIKSEDSFSLKNTTIAFIEYMLHELIMNGKLLGSLFMLTLFSVLLQTMHTAFESSAVSKIAYFVIYLVLIFIALNSFYLAVSYTQEAIEAMKGFMIALLPLVLGMMSTFGNVISVSFFHPVIIFLINFSGILVSTFILPLLFLSALLLIVSSMNDNYKVTHLANLFRSVALGTLGVFLTIFLGVISVQGAAAAIQDGIAMKTAKFITGNFIPVVGRTFTDAADTILSASLILKNAVGMAGLLIVLFIVLFPAIKIAAIALIYKLAAAALQPIGGGPVISTLNTISNYILYILACLLAVSLMFLLAIVIIVSASNITILMR
ncbi:stage III sporulation protein AE [Oceanobacillus damuensis]|uniref:stage III sporulation protein AE n=1 Tax=Oceanobacillus damuensis TaxID=937928 RepID=UPI00082A8A60|nr:stage III sporulation protein AE [Oceanobacillus damuensis]